MNIAGMPVAESEAVVRRTLRRIWPDDPRGDQDDLAQDAWVRLLTGAPASLRHFRRIASSAIIDSVRRLTRMRARELSRGDMDPPGSPPRRVEWALLECIMSPRQREIVELLRTGHTQTEVAHILGLSHRGTVNTQMHRLRAKARRLAPILGLWGRRCR